MLAGFGGALGLRRWEMLDVSAVKQEGIDEQDQYMCGARLKNDSGHD